MKCKKCGNKKSFTMVREVAFWNEKEKKFEDATEDGDEFIVCDKCMAKASKINTEEDY